MKPSTMFGFFTSLFVFALSACASLPVSEKTKMSEPSRAESGVPSDILPPQKLGLGQCGLFIWTADTTPKFIGFESANEAKFVMDGKIEMARRTEETTNDPLRRTYLLPETNKSLSLNLERDGDIAEGERFVGRLTSTTSEGWDKLVPVVALLSCQAA